MGRTGPLFCFEHAGVRPDILTLGKGIGTGTPLAALLSREDVCCFEPGDQGGTYNGNALMAAVGLAVLKQPTSPGFLKRVCEAAALLCHGLAELREKHGLSGVRGRGLLLALDLKPRMMALPSWKRAWRTDCWSTLRLQTRCASCRPSMFLIQRSPRCLNARISCSQGIESRRAHFTASNWADSGWVGGQRSSAWPPVLHPSGSKLRYQKPGGAGDTP